MFNLKEFITRNIVNGIKNGSFSKEYGSILAVNYLAKGILSEVELASIDEQVTEWENAQAVEVEEPTEEEPTDEPTEEVEEIPTDEVETD